MADHEHIQMFVDGIYRVGARWVSAGRQDIGFTASLDDVGRMTTTSPFGMVSVNGASFESGDGIFHETGFV